jgi:hypothetical protein
VKTRNNPALYERLTKPRSRADVEASREAFDQELYALREKHGIADMLIVHAMAITEPDGTSLVEIGTGYYGNASLAIQLAAAGFSIWKREAHRQIDEAAAVIAGVGKPKRKRAKKEPTK